jgi:thymidylate synthase ThyX
MNYWNFDNMLATLLKIPRGEFDKLPNHFEKVSADFSGIMSFRSWRDLQRQQYCTHYRTFVTTDFGFYSYNKPAPKEFFDACKKLWQSNVELYRIMKEHGVPPELMQYPLAMGNLIGFSIAGNLAQMEFCIWQRTKFSVNHEVRQIFTAMETLIREVYPWWGSISAAAKISRADLTPAYVFARTQEGIPLILS